MCSMVKQDYILYYIQEYGMRLPLLLYTAIAEGKSRVRKKAKRNDKYNYTELTIVVEKRSDFLVPFPL